MGLRKFIHQNILKMKKIYYLTLAAMARRSGRDGNGFRQKVPRIGFA